MQTIKNTILGASLVLFLGACAGSTSSPDRAMAEACGNAYPTTLNALYPLKPRMTEDQITAVDTAIVYISEACDSYFTGESIDLTQSLLEINRRLRELLLIKSNLGGSV